jgi:hypothetical protein
MRILDYPRHFLLLGGGAMALAGMTRLPSLFAGRLLLLFGVVGALHAMAVVLGLRSRPSWPACLGFVAAAAGASIAAPLVPGGSEHLPSRMRTVEVRQYRHRQRRPGRAVRRILGAIILTGR